MMTSALPALAHVLVTRILGFYLAGPMLYLVPLGAGVVGLMVTGGSISAARYMNVIAPTKVDALIIMSPAGSTMFLHFYLDAGPSLNVGVYTNASMWTSTMPIHSARPIRAQLTASHFLDL